ncbi:MAG: PAS domain S-box protein [Gemmatimonadaceae bacterium]
MPDGPFATYFDNARVGLGVLSSGNRWIVANDRLCELLGYSRAELLARDHQAIVDREDWQAEAEEFARIRSGEVSATQIEERYRRKDGTPLWVSVTAARSASDRGEGCSLLLVVTDLTSRRETQRGLSVQHLVSRLIAQSRTPAETISTVLSEVARTLRWSYASYWELDRVDLLLHPTKTFRSGGRQFEDFDRETRGLTLRLGEGVPGHVWNSLHPFWESDVATPARYPRSVAASRDGLHSVFAFPVKSAEKFFGIMEFFGEDILPPDQTLLNAAEGVGYQLGEFLERSRALGAEHESEVRKASILDTALDCIITSDERSIITEFNPAAEATFGYRKEDVIGKPMVDLIIPPAHREAHLRGMARYLATGEAHVLGRRIEIEAMRSDGSIFPVELAIVRVPLPGPAFFTAYVRDLTQRRQLEAEQARLLKESEEANRAKSEFLATMSHELRTPLNAIAGYAELLKMGLRGPVNEAQVADLERINRSQAHLLSIINDILQFAKVESGQLEINVEDFPVESALVVAEELVKPQADAKKISLSYEPGDASVLVRADRDRFQQILLNLLSNALKFTGEGGSIRLGTDSLDHQVLVRVSDTGIGIDPDQLERIFDPFIQVESGPTRAQEGVGLGLAISRDMARQMGGDVSVTSERGKGSTFTLALPRAN